MDQRRGGAFECRLAKADRHGLVFVTASRALHHPLLEGGEVAREDLEGQIPELDRVRLGLLGIDPPEPLPAGGAEIVSQLRWATRRGPPLPVSLVLGLELFDEARLQERAVVLATVKQPDYELYVLRLILAAHTRVHAALHDPARLGVDRVKLAGTGAVR